MDAIQKLRIGMAEKVFIEFQGVLQGQQPGGPPAPGTAAQHASADSVLGKPRQAAGAAASGVPAAAVGAGPGEAIAAAAAAAGTEALEPPAEGCSGSGSGEDEALVSHMFLWPVDAATMGPEGAPGGAVASDGGADAAGAATSQPLVADEAIVRWQDLPRWLYGTHSVRFGPGPEWSKPAATELAAGGGPAGNGDGACSAVMWVTGG